jgi:hypothetical protein
MTCSLPHDSSTLRFTTSKQDFAFLFRKISKKSSHSAVKCMGSSTNEIIYILCFTIPVTLGKLRAKTFQLRPENIIAKASSRTRQKILQPIYKKLKKNNSSIVVPFIGQDFNKLVSTYVPERAP